MIACDDTFPDAVSGTWIDTTGVCPDGIGNNAGNMISGPKAGDESTRLHFVYDAWNRVVAVKADDNGQPGTTIATYGYDGLGRRMSNNPAGGAVDYYCNNTMSHHVLGLAERKQTI